MYQDLPCGCRIDDLHYSTIHEDAGRSFKDVNRNKRHWPIGYTPETLCISCDLTRPCNCDRAEAREAMVGANATSVELRATEFTPTVEEFAKMSPSQLEFARAQALKRSGFSVGKSNDGTTASLDDVHTDVRTALLERAQTSIPSEDDRTPDVTPGLHIHYKGGKYTVIAVAWDSTDPQPKPRRRIVFYVSLTTGELCSREQEQFRECVEWDVNGVKYQWPRFLRVTS